MQTQNGSVNSNTDFTLEKDRRLLDYAYDLKQMREAYEPIGYLSRRAYEGKHFTFWNKQLKQLSEVPSKKSFVTALPEIKNQTDKFENFLVSTDYTFTVIPKLLSEDDAVKDSMMLSMLARTYYEKLKNSTVMADWIHFALVDPNVSFIEITPNAHRDDVDYRFYDFFDILFNPLIKNWSDQRTVVKVVKKYVTDIKRSSLYHLPPDYKGAGVGGEWTSWKDIYNSERYQGFADMQKDQMLLFEFYILEDYTNEKGKPDTRLRIKTLDGMGLVIRNDVYEAVKLMPIQPLRIYSGEWYQPSYVYGLIGLNRSLDTMINRFDDLFVRLTKGGWVTQEEEDIQGQMNEEVGQIIKYASVEPKPIQMGQVPNFFVQLFQSFLSLSERYGLNSIFSGNMPQKSSGLRSNKMIDSIKGLTLQNNTATVNNLRASLKSVLEITFGFLYEMWEEPQDKIESDDTQHSPKFISAKYQDLSNQEDNVFVIPKEFKKFMVEVDDGMGYTIKERQAMATQLYEMKDEGGKPILSSQALKKIFKMGASGYLMEADDKPMHETKEFQQLIGSFSSMSDQEKQALITTLQTIGKQQASTMNPQDAGKEMIQGAAGAPPGGAPPAAPPQAPQPKPPAPPGGGH